LPRGAFVTRVAARARFSALVLIAPLALFLAVFFVWPLVTMLTTAVTDGVVRTVFPKSAEAVADWNREMPVPEALEQALVEDLRTVEDQAAFGDAVRRLNSAVPGYRSLLSRTLSAARTAPPDSAVSLADIDPRWGEARYWTAFADAVPRFTDRNLLAALDLGRNAEGAIISGAGEASANRVIMIRTFGIAAAVTALCAAIGLPYAMLAATATGWLRMALLLAVLLPLWTSLLVRTAAWFILLQNEGLINRTLMGLWIIDSPIALIFNRTGVVIAMTHVLLPFMVLPIYSVIVGIPKNLMQAAGSLGAPPLRAFFHVLLPLSLPGLLSGSLLVFMVALGYYITPALLGGANDQMISSVIAFYAMGTANWGMAAALGIFLLTATMALYAVYSRLSDTPQMTGR
jgi:putative spermidine/putrescine transport system permease protein